MDKLLEVNELTKQFSQGNVIARIKASIAQQKLDAEIIVVNDLRVVHECPCIVWVFVTGGNHSLRYDPSPLERQKSHSCNLYY